MINKINMPCVTCKEPLPDSANANRIYCRSCKELRRLFKMNQSNKKRSIKTTFALYRKHLKGNTKEVNDLLTIEILDTLNSLGELEKALQVSSIGVSVGRT